MTPPQDLYASTRWRDGAANVDAAGRDHAGRTLSRCQWHGSLSSAARSATPL